MSSSTVFENLKLFAASTKLDPILKIAESSSRIILDVDLDFFSTKNPFLDLFPKSGLYSKLKTVYSFESVPPNLTAEEKKLFSIESSKKRSKLIEKLQDLTNYLQENRCQCSKLSLV